MEKIDMEKIEEVWNEAQAFSRDLISDAWLDLNWDDLPENVQGQFRALVSEDIPNCKECQCYPEERNDSPN